MSGCCMVSGDVATGGVMGAQKAMTIGRFERREYKTNRKDETSF